VYHLGYHCKCLHGSRADTRSQQQIGKVQIQIEAILHRRAINLRHQAACLGKSCSVDADLVTDGNEFLRRSPRMVASPSTDMNSELATERRQPSLERADDARRDAGGMPVHAHHCAEGLKPERIGQPPQQLVAS
jgi:hypothetical protein